MKEAEDRKQKMNMNMYLTDSSSTSWRIRSVGKKIPISSYLNT